MVRLLVQICALGLNELINRKLCWCSYNYVNDNSDNIHDSNNNYDDNNGDNDNNNDDNNDNNYDNNKNDDDEDNNDDSPVSWWWQSLISKFMTMWSQR